MDYIPVYGQATFAYLRSPINGPFSCFHLLPTKNVLLWIWVCSKLRKKSGVWLVPVCISMGRARVAMILLCSNPLLLVEHNALWHFSSLSCVWVRMFYYFLTSLSLNITDRKRGSLIIGRYKPINFLFPIWTWHFWKDWLSKFWVLSA